MRSHAAYILLAIISKVVDATPIPNGKRSASPITPAVDSAKTSQDTPRINPHVHSLPVNQPATSGNAAVPSTDGAPKLPSDVVHGDNSDASKSFVDSTEFPYVIAAGGVVAVASGIALWRYKVNKNAAITHTAALQGDQAVSNSWKAYDEEVFFSIGAKYQALANDLKKLATEGGMSEAIFQKRMNVLADRAAGDTTVHEMRIQERVATDIPPVAGSDAWLMDHTAQLYLRYPELQRLDTNYYGQHTINLPESEVRSVAAHDPVRARVEQLTAELAKSDPPQASAIQSMMYYTDVNAKKRLAIQDAVKLKVDPTLETFKAGEDAVFELSWLVYGRERARKIELVHHGKVWEEVKALEAEYPGTLEAAKYIRDSSSAREIEIWNEEQAQRIYNKLLPVDTFTSDLATIIYDLEDVQKAAARAVREKASIITHGYSREDPRSAMGDSIFEMKAKKIDQELNAEISSIIERLPLTAQNAIYREVWRAVLAKEQGVLTPIDRSVLDSWPSTFDLLDSNAKPTNLLEEEAQGGAGAEADEAASLVSDLDRDILPTVEKEGQALEKAAIENLSKIGKASRI